jgi:hypothetical protein
MIKIVKMEYSGYPVRSVETVSHKDINFYDLTALDRTKADFTKDFRVELSEVSHINRIVDEGTHIRINYMRENNGFLFIYPEKDKKPAKKRATKNLDTLVAQCNKAGCIASFHQMQDSDGSFHWMTYILDAKSFRVLAHDDLMGAFRTPYQSLKNAIANTNGYIKLC